MKFLKNNYIELILVTIILLGVFLRLILIIDIDFFQFQYDIGTEELSEDISNEDTDQYYENILTINEDYLRKDGNLGYILTIFSTGKLPDFYSNQAYHPPFYYILSACFLKVLDIFGCSATTLVESSVLPSFIFYLLTLLVVYKILKEFDLENKYMILPMTIISFYPLLVYMSRVIHNDMLLTLLALASTLFLIKWYKNPCIKSTIILALLVGLGCSTKFSMMVMALPLLFVYMSKIVLSKSNGQSIKKYFLHGFIFLVICLPLLLWYPVRNYIELGEGLFAVMPGADNLAVGSDNFTDRWLLNSELFNDNELKADASNIWAYLINSSILYMISFTDLPDVFVIILKIILILFLAAILYSIINCLIKSKDKFSLLILIVTAFSWMLGYVYYNDFFPFSCTMHARYVACSIIIGIIFLGLNHKYIKNKIANILMYILTAVFSITSIAMFAYEILYIF